MGKLLLVSDLEANQLTLLEKALQAIETSIDEIILHYAYKIPTNTQSVIESHDKIKNEANEKLLVQANNIIRKTGIKTSVNLSLGSENSTLKRMLANDSFHYVLTTGKKIDKLFETEFPHIKFINN